MEPCVGKSDVMLRTVHNSEHDNEPSYLEVLNLRLELASLVGRDRGGDDLQ